MRRLFLGTAVLFAALGSAQGADLARPRAPAAAGHHWSGFYVGVLAGYGDGTADIGMIPGGRWFSDNEATFLAANGSPRIKAGGFTGGGEIGYNRQFGTTLVGVEGDFSATLLKARRLTGTFAPFPVTGDTYMFTSAFDAPWLSTVRGRLGSVFADNTLVYVTGGLALAKFDYQNGYIFGLGPGLGGSLIPQVAVGRASRVNAGFAVGAGLEQALGANWSVKAEYLYADLGRGGTFGTAEFINGKPTNNGYITTDKASLRENLFRVGLNYRFAAD